MTWPSTISELLDLVSISAAGSQGIGSIGLALLFVAFVWWVFRRRRRGKAVALLVVGMIGLLLWASWDIVRVLLQEPAVTWHTVVADFLASSMVLWLRQTVGDRVAAWIGLAFATMVALSLAFELWAWWVLRWRSLARRRSRRLSNHWIACQACQQLANAAPDDFSDDDEDKYCPAGQRLHRAWVRWT
jgi:hypothetical protein